MRIVQAAWLVGSASILLGAVCSGQDRRSVTEPHVPEACARVEARLETHSGGLTSEYETSLDTDRLQRALSGCAAGKAVELTTAAGRDAFLSGPLELPPGVTLVIDRGVTLFASRDADLYARTPGSCGVVNAAPPGCRPLIEVKDAPHAAVMGEGVIDGRGGAKLLHSGVTWWDLAEKARAGGRQQVPRLIVITGSDDFTLYRITLKNSPNFHVTFGDGKGFTVWGVIIDTPRGARNTDGIDPGGSASDITVTHSWISTGDDQVAIKGSGKGVDHMSVIDNHFYAGHGMSIGSETFGGVSDVLVRGLTLDGADNGIRIKSNVHRGGLVQRIRYEDVCIRDTKMPITLDTRYDNPGPSDQMIPAFKDVVLHGVAVSGGGNIVVDGVDQSHATHVQFDGVQLDNPASYKTFASHAVVTYGPGAANFRLGGDDVSAVQSKPDATSAVPPSCTGRFVPLKKAR